MRQFSNPIGRLHNLLDDVMRNSGKNMRSTWALALGVAEDDHCSILRGFGHVFELIDEGRSCVARASLENETLYLAPLNEVEDALAGCMNLSLNIVELRKRIEDRSTLTKLEYCAERIEQEGLEQIFEKDALDELLVKVTDLITEVLHSDMPEHLQALLYDNLENLRRAILEFRIRGPKGLRTAVDLSIGSLIRHRDGLKDPAAQSFFRKLWEILTSADGLTARALRISTVLAKARELLGYQS